METIGDYEYHTKDLIGHGAFAVVFKGRHKSRHESVAIKSITKKNLQRSQSLLSKEIKILEELTELHHENVVSLLNCKETQHHVYLVMEYCNGGDLADYLQSKGALSEDTIRLFIRQIAGAMKALNAKGIVHRDLKPQNILLCHDSDKPNPSPVEIKLKIADFGFARFLEDGVMAATLCGSPMYMAPEVIMSLKYDAKADLWSIATIVFQCLTGKAPFHAQTPQQLKQFYEKHPNLAPIIPSGTSPELSDLLLRLLRRNAKDRMEFDEFFEHPFLRAVPSKPMPVPRSSQHPSPLSASPIQSPISYGSPMMPIAAHSPKVADEFPSTASSSGSSDHVDDFVMVTADPNCNNVIGRTPSPKRRIGKHRAKKMVSPLLHHQPEPIPVPTQKQAYEQIQRSCGSSNSSGTMAVVSSDSTVVIGSGNNNAMITSPPATPKSVHSQKSNLQRHDSQSSIGSTGSGTGSGSYRSRLFADISQLSPPTVKFVIGTPPGGSAGTNAISLNHSRRRSAPIVTALGSGNQTPPPHYRQMTPPAFSSPSSAPFRTVIYPVPTSAAPTSVLQPIKGSPPHDYNPYLCYNPPWTFHGSKTEPSLAAANVNAPIGTTTGNLAFGSGTSRGFYHVQSYPEKMVIHHHTHQPHQYNQYPYHYCGYGYAVQEPVSPIFAPLELPAETLLDREHNETLAKLNFVLALVDCILDLAEYKANPIEILKSSCKELPSESYRKTEQLVLHIRALQLLSSALQLSRREIESGRLTKSETVKKVLCSLKDRFHHCLNTCKSLDSNSLLNSVNQKTFESISADKLIYNYAIEMCQSAALEELFGQDEECFRRYNTAQILLHSLLHHVNSEDDRKLLNRYKDAVQKRLYHLQRRGIVLAYDNSPIP